MKDGTYTIQPCFLEQNTDTAALNQSLQAYVTLVTGLFINQFTPPDVQANRREDFEYFILKLYRLFFF